MALDIITYFLVASMVAMLFGGASLEAQCHLRIRATSSPDPVTEKGTPAPAGSSPEPDRVESVSRRPGTWEQPPNVENGES